MCNKFSCTSGVRYSILNPSAYIQSNIVGFLKLIEYSFYMLVTVQYIGNKMIPFKESDNVDHPISICNHKNLMN